MQTVCVVGIWHLGIVNAVGFSKKGYNVIGLTRDSLDAKKLNKGTPPLYEPGLEESMRQSIDKKILSFTNDAKLIKKADYVIIAYDSPVDENDQVNIIPIVEAADLIAPYLQIETPVIITSQLPVGSSEKIEKQIFKKNSLWRGGVAYVPENLRLGNALELFLKPDMLVLGTNNPATLKKITKLYMSFKTQKINMSLTSAEMVKHALNAFLATSIAFGNEIASICDFVGADAVAVTNALTHDRRIKGAPIFPGLGFSGGTLARDIQQLKKIAKKNGHNAPLIDSIMTINDGTFDQVIEKLQNKIGSLKNKKIGILGLTYKPGTSTIRRSPAIKIIEKLNKLGAHCFAYDPKADKEELASFKHLFNRVLTIEELANNADALVLLTQWPKFTVLPFDNLARLMRCAFILDAKNFLDPDSLKKDGFEYVGFGR